MISLRSLAAVMAVTPFISRVGLYSTMSAPIRGALIDWMMGKDLAGGEAAGFVVRDAGGEGGVEAV